MCTEKNMIKVTIFRTNVKTCVKFALKFYLARQLSRFCVASC